jgi:hypothetical protein
VVVVERFGWPVVFVDEAPVDVPMPVDVLPVPALPLIPAAPPLAPPAAPAPPPPPPWAKALSGKTIATASAAARIDFLDMVVLRV